MEALPHSELARRSAGGDGGAFVRLYDQYCADIFEVSLGATGSVEAASASTEAAFLRLLKHPPALGATDAEVSDRLSALALGHGIDGGGVVTTVGVEVEQLRSETVLKAGELFDEDWSAHLLRRPAPPPARTEPLRESVVAERVVELVPRRPARRSLVTFLEELPLQAAGVVVLGLAVLILAAAVVRMHSDNPRGATPAAEAADQQQQQQQQRDGTARTRSARRP